MPGMARDPGPFNFKRELRSLTTTSFGFKPTLKNLANTFIYLFILLLLSRKRFSKFLQRRLQKLSKNRFSDDFEKQTFLQPLHPKVEKNIDALFSHEMRRDRFVVDFEMHFLFILARSHLFSLSCFSQESGIICYNWMQNES